MNNPHGTLRSAIIKAIRDLTAEQGHPPAIREIGTRISCRGVGNIHRTLHDLRDDGVVTWEDGRRRTIRIIREGPTRAQMDRWADDELRRVLLEAADILNGRALSGMAVAA